MQFNSGHRIGLLLMCMAIILIVMLSLSAQCTGSTDKTFEQPIDIETKEPTEVETEPPPVFIVTSEERETLARLVYLEARGESYECQKAVISVVINRWMSGYWGDTINSVVYAPKQFSVARRIKTTTPNQMQYDVVDDVLQKGTTLPYYVMYFRADYHHRWRGYTGYIVMDNTYFGYMSKDKI